VGTCDFFIAYMCYLVYFVYMNDVITKIGKKKGPTSVIMAGVHGNEVCGIKAFKKIIPKLEIERGTVHFIIGNPKAVKANKRYIGFNMNRLFIKKSFPEKIRKTYEYSKAQDIKKFLNESDALLDIHSTTNKSEPFIICEKRSFNVAKSLPKEFKKIVYGFDGIEPGGTDGYMNKQGKIGICIECGQHLDKKSITIAIKAIQIFLENRKHINFSKVKNPSTKKQIIQINSIYNTKTNSFVLSKTFNDFTPIKKGEIIGVDGNTVVYAKNNSIILFAHSSSVKGSEGFLLGK